MKEWMLLDCLTASSLCYKILFYVSMGEELLSHVSPGVLLSQTMAWSKRLEFNSFGARNSYSTVQHGLFQAHHLTYEIPKIENKMNWINLLPSRFTNAVEFTNAIQMSKCGSVTFSRLLLSTLHLFNIAANK